MNRIILIGNGFDKAHNLKTGYDDFINWYWTQWGEQLLKSNRYVVSDELTTIGIREGSGISGWEDIMFNYIKHSDSPKEILAWVKNHPSSCFINCKSNFFNSICKQLELGWVDIENIFYELLKSCKISSDAKVLNDELDIIKNKLINYLNIIEQDLTKEIINNNILNHFYEPINKDDITLPGREYLVNLIDQRLHFNEDMVYDLVSSYFSNQYAVHTNCSAIKRFINKYRDTSIEDIDSNEIPFSVLLPDKTMVLNFNYTSTAEKYFSKNDHIIINHIHGSLSDLNSVIFGYGDELDENYKVLLNKNDNEYLRQIKQYRYLENSNYRQLREFIESDAYQIFIMGHSCGNSDRTLLNTLFEHKNCISIKPFYHKKDDGSDNYIDIIQNISRNFNNQQIMRDRVVNKKLCMSLS